MNDKKNHAGMRRPAVLLALIFFSTAWAGGQAADGLRLSRDGQSNTVIVVPLRATPVEQTAARELQTHLRQVTGARFPIVSEDGVPPAAPRILIGAGALTRKLWPALDPAKLPPDAIVIKTVGRDLILAGHPRRGSLYAVYTFLEETVGVRWWTSTEARIPKRPTLTIPALDINYAPKVIDRATRYLSLSDGSFLSHKGISKQEQRAMGVLSARLRLNGHDHYSIPAEYGGPNLMLGWVHTMSEIEPLMPTAKYFKEHPEWYALIKGQRRDKNTQLCLTNEALREEMVRNVLARLRRSPEATIISVSQNDNHSKCECAPCRAVEEREGSPSGQLITFVNAVAEEVEKEFPKVYVETLAYVYTRKPPRFARPRHNVIVRLCSIECSFSEPLESSRLNKAFREDIEGWSRIAPQLYIWDYVTNFTSYLIPHPNLHVLAPNLRFFVRNKAIGIFEQGDSGSRTGDFIRLRAWLLAHLLWNPDADENQLVQEFLTGYYGAAAPALRAYLDLMSQAVQRSGKRLGCYMPDTTSWLKLEDLNQATRLFDQALAAVSADPVLSRRVRRERLPVDLVWLQRHEALKRQAGAQGLEFLGPKDRAAACREFIRLATEHQVGEFRQGRPFSAYAPLLVSGQ